MGSKNKLKRFNENDTFHNVFQPKREELVDAEYPLKGQWNEQFFKNKNPLVLELGCGKGEYTAESTHILKITKLTALSEIVHLFGACMVGIFGLEK